MDKLALGTAQFGLDYGVNNSRGKIPRDEVEAILDSASSAGIEMLDTASVYGNSEGIIGDYINKVKQNFKIVSKLPRCSYAEAEGIFEGSLKRLGQSKIYGYLVHDFSFFCDNPWSWELLKKNQAFGKIGKTGFSLYHPSELEYILKNSIKVDLLQIPYSLFDRRFEPYFSVLKDKGIELHVRSIFLQGLVFKQPDQLSSQFDSIKPKIFRLRQISDDTGLNLAALCLNFVLSNGSVDKTIVGIDNLNNLNDMFCNANAGQRVGTVLDDLKALKEDSEDILIPSKWRGVCCN
ncbi:MAG: aldo/keto reductase [Candidatus Margulisbacteria bacterium]|nr:aldo/keto reductase [Candidatus Margulisiibacteriota bacterium]